MIHVEVRGKVPGADGDGLPDVLVELEAGVTTVRELIRLAVGEQVLNDDEHLSDPTILAQLPVVQIPGSQPAEPQADYL